VLGPLLDRIDPHVEVPRLPSTLFSGTSGKTTENSETIRNQVTTARTLGLKQCNYTNDSMRVNQVQTHCWLGNAANLLLERATVRFGLSHRAYHRILKVTRIIADLTESRKTESAHLGKAIGYRNSDRSF
jgi:magnesium chelatase family protein